MIGEVGRREVLDSVGKQTIIRGTVLVPRARCALVRERSTGILAFTNLVGAAIL